MQPIRKFDETRVAARRSAKLVRAVKSLDANETNELQQLFDLMADACDAATMFLSVGSGPERVRELTERIDAMVGRTKAILG